MRHRPDGQVVFASPLASNPELLLEGAAAAVNPTAVAAETITVNQNLLWADQVRYYPTRWNLRLVVDGRPVGVGEFELSARRNQTASVCRSSPSRLAAPGGANVVYVNGAADAERRLPVRITTPSGQRPTSSSDQGIIDLRELVSARSMRSTPWPPCCSAASPSTTATCPLLARTEIERLADCSGPTTSRLFRNGTLHYLVCPSTLLEGVNLPCRNLFARNPKKCNGNPMSAADFWILAGRAGRWGEEFQDNIVCVDASRRDRWPDLPTTRTRQPVERATSTALADVSGVVSYFEGGAPLDAADARETIYSYLATRVLSGADVSDLPQVSTADADRLTAAVQAVSEGTDITTALVQRHVGISPAAMQRLLNRFRTYDNADDLVLALPEGTDATDTYVRALGLIASLERMSAAPVGADLFHEDLNACGARRDGTVSIVPRARPA